jgi:hypothetical protein
MFSGAQIEHIFELLEALLAERDEVDNGRAIGLSPARLEVLPYLRLELL